MNRPTCGTCPHRVKGACFLQPAEWQDERWILPVKDTRPGCQHHPAMGKWLESLEEPAAQPVAESKPQRYGYRQPEKTLSDELAELSVVREWLMNLPYPPPGETLAELLAGVSAGWQAHGNALAELEQWRRTFAWLHRRGGSMYSLQIVVSGVMLSEVTLTDDWLVGRGGQRYPSRDAAMRAAEAALGLPRCRVEGER